MRFLIVASLLIASVLVIAFVGDAFGSEYYFFMPGKGPNALNEPPSSPKTVVFAVASSVVFFFVSPRNRWLGFAIWPIFAILGLPIGILCFGWTPGAAQYLLILCMIVLAVLVWSNSPPNKARSTYFPNDP
jgi:hypothetical protein